MKGLLYSAMALALLGLTAGCCTMDRPRIWLPEMGACLQESARKIVRPPNQWCWPYTPAEECATQVPDLVIDGLDKPEVPA